MGQQSSSGKQTVDGTVTTQVTTLTLPFSMPSGATLLCKKSAGDGVSTGATIHSVTAGKTFYLLGFIMSVQSSASYVRLTMNGTDTIGSWCQASGNVTVPPGLYPIASCTAGGSGVTFTHGAGAGNGYCTIWGYEA